MPDADDPLRVTALVKKYGDVTAVDDVTFRVPPGRIFCLLGPNGAGKTTTLEVAQGLKRPSSGTVRVFGEDPWRVGPALKRRLGVLPQKFTCYPDLTVRENVQYFADIYGVDPDIPDLLRRLGLEDDIDRRYRTLSGGTARRVGIATALVNDPELVFLDEPTAGVDPANRRNLWEVVRALKAEGRAIVLTTHYMDEAERLADELAIVDRGRVVAHGTPETVRREHGGGSLLVLRGLEGALPACLDGRDGVLRDESNAVLVPLAESADGPVLIAEIMKSEASFQEIGIREPTLDDAFVRLVSAAGDDA